jgi:hypothetical protein
MRKVSMRGADDHVFPPLHVFPTNLAKVGFAAVRRDTQSSSTKPHDQLKSERPLSSLRALTVHYWI